MIFVTTSKNMSMYGSGKCIGKDRYEISNGLKVFFYDSDSIEKEFSDYGLINYKDIDEPIKFLEGEEPLKMLQIVCKK